MSIRDERQEEFAKAFLKVGYGILYLCPRFGKIKTTINILNTLKNPKILICYPDLKIKNSWIDDFKKWKYKNGNITYTTYLSLKNNIDEYDFVIFDEIHLMSEAQIKEAKKVLGCKHVLGLTGTLSSNTKNIISKELNLSVIRDYAIDIAIQEGVITDYEINIIKVKLDDTDLKYKSGTRTEKSQYKALSFVIDKLEGEGKPTFMLRLQRMRLIQDSISKLGATKNLLNTFKKERCLVFCGKANIADKMGCRVYHSNNKDEDVFKEFINGKGDNHLAVVKMMNQGVTIKPINYSIINYFDSNPENLAQKISRMTNFEYDRPDKKAVVYIITTDELVELAWLSKALSMFSRNKIKYL